MDYIKNLEERARVCNRMDVLEGRMKKWDPLTKGMKGLCQRLIGNYKRISRVVDRTEKAFAQCMAQYYMLADQVEINAPPQYTNWLRQLDMQAVNAVQYCNKKSDTRKLE